MNPGKTGAKRQSFTPDNPRAVMDQIIASHPKWGEELIFKHWSEKMESSEDYRAAVYEYWFTNNFRSHQKHAAQPMPPEPSRARVPPPRLVKTTEDIKREKVEQEKRVADIVAQISLLTMIAPNGKRLSECSGTECEAFGGWYQSVGRRVGRRLVGNVMTEGALHDIRKSFWK